MYRSYIGDKAPDALSLEEEVDSLGVDAVVEKGKTIFPKLDDDTPFLWDYQLRGFFKGSCGVLRKVPSTLSSKIKAYKKQIDGLVFVEPRRIPIMFDGDMRECQRPLRAQTAQGERVSLAISEEIPSGAQIEFTVVCLLDKDADLVREWLDYGSLVGIGQWRNSGKGRFKWEEITE